MALLGHPCTATQAETPKSGHPNRPRARRWTHFRSAVWFFNNSISGATVSSLSSVTPWRTDDPLIKGLPRWHFRGTTSSCERPDSICSCQRRFDGQSEDKSTEGQLREQSLENSAVTLTVLARNEALLCYQISAKQPFYSANSTSSDVNRYESCVPDALKRRNSRGRRLFFSISLFIQCHFHHTYLIPTKLQTWYW